MQLSARTLLAMFSVMVVVACGGDDPKPSGCTTGQMSTPGGADDPCQQNDMRCLMLNGKGVAMCNGGTWGQCYCMAPQAPSTPSTAGTTGATTTCGDGVVQANEMCEQGKVPSGMTCESLMGKGATGLVMCKQCMIDTTMCAAPTTTGGGGSGAMVTGGSGAMVGAGGSGR